MKPVENTDMEITREIKFRVWNGDEMVYDVTVGKFGVFYVNPANNGLDPNYSASLTPFTTKYHEDTPVMQFTGLQDKTATAEIYEADILEDEGGNRGVVIWNQDDCSFVVDFGAHGLHNLYRNDHPAASNHVLYLKRIGNIYQNPELLK